MAKEHLVTESIAEVAKELSEATRAKIDEICTDAPDARLHEVIKVADKNARVADDIYQAIDADNPHGQRM